MAKQAATDKRQALPRRSAQRTGGRQVARGRQMGTIPTLLLTGLLLFAPSAIAQQPPQQPPDGFVPADSLKPQEQLPAAPLVIGAYAVAWVAVFGYLWSIWNRLGRVERDLAEVSRRQSTGDRR
jgi:CcmD family protein